jgi:class 3 adenylate cyclase
VKSNFLINITSKGIKPNMSVSDEKIVIITNYILLIASVVAFGRIFMFYISGDFGYSMISMTASILFLTSYYINIKGHFDIAKFFLILVGNSAVLWKELSSGGQGNQLFLIIASFSVVFLLFDIKNKSKIAFALMIPGFSFVMTIFLPNIISEPIAISPEMIKLEKFVGVFSGVIIVVMVTWYFVKKSNDAEVKLIESNNLLKDLNDELYSQKGRIEELLNKSDKLLLNVLPAPIAERLKEGETLIADIFAEASIIFIDIADFTKYSLISSPENIVKELNRIFTKIDKISSKYNIEKIKTLGDCYMAASGIPKPRHDHAEMIARMAIEVIDEMKDFITDNGVSLKFRIGIDCGPVVAGVIGEQKFIYDLWGDPVNTASRMEDYGVIGKIHCTERFKKAIEKSKTNVNPLFSMGDNTIKDIIFEERGDIEIKGKGTMRTYFMEKNLDI